MSKQKVTSKKKKVTSKKKRQQTKKYYFYTSNTKLQNILDELRKNRMLSGLIEDTLANGIEKQIKKRLKELEKLGDVYKK